MYAAGFGEGNLCWGRVLRNQSGLSTDLLPNKEIQCLSKRYNFRIPEDAAVIPKMPTIIIIYLGLGESLERPY